MDKELAEYPKHTQNQFFNLQKTNQSRDEEIMELGIIYLSDIWGWCEEKGLKGGRKEKNDKEEEAFM